jgi:hypothetical protein
MSDAKSWYANKFGAQGAARRDAAPLPPQNAGQGLPQQPNPYGTPQPAPVPDNARTGFEAAFAQGDAAGGTRTQSLAQRLQNNRCPECGGPDVTPSDGRNAARCFGCGWNQGRITHELH